jgi:hypothetical protein
VKSLGIEPGFRGDKELLIGPPAMYEETKKNKVERNCVNSLKLKYLLLKLDTMHFRSCLFICD